MSENPIPHKEKELREALETNPADWETRKQLAHLLYDQGAFQKAADVIWEVDEIPSIDLELAFAARVLAKASPRKAIRLLSALLEHNHGKAVQNLGLANALLHHGMVLQAARFYGAALEADPSLGNPDLEHFILWTDDEETLWGDFKDRRPKLGELPWMKRDPREAMKLTSRVSTHTTPIRLASLKAVAGEELGNELYQQTPEKGAQPTPPPAVTIPMDRVDPKHRLFDSELGAPDVAAPAKPAKPAALPPDKPAETAEASPPPAKPVKPAASLPAEVSPPAATKPLATPQFVTPAKPAKPAELPPAMPAETAAEVPPPAKPAKPKTLPPAKPVEPAAETPPPAKPVKPAAPPQDEVPAPAATKPLATPQFAPPAKPAAAPAEKPAETPAPAKAVASAPPAKPPASAPQSAPAQPAKPAGKASDSILPPNVPDLFEAEKTQGTAYRRKTVLPPPRPKRTEASE